MEGEACRLGEELKDENSSPFKGPAVMMEQWARFVWG